MLVELSVENLAVIESVRVRFHAGLNLLTGETGSGKSIVVDALGLLLGGRASAEMVRAGATRARVSGIFEVTATPALLALLEELGIEIEEGELLIEREIQPSGKSRAFAGSRPVTAALLRDLAPHIADIHGQHDQQQLFSSDVQCRMLDAFARTEPVLQRVEKAFAGWRQSQNELEELDRTAQEKLRAGHSRHCPRIRRASLLNWASSPKSSMSSRGLTSRLWKSMRPWSRPEPRSTTRRAR
jgi:DNA repair protein RecN (Recombination protein N)